MQAVKYPKQTYTCGVGFTFHFPSYNLTFYKSSAYTALSHEFATFLIENAMGINVHNYFKKFNASMPEEHLYASLFKGSRWV